MHTVVRFSLVFLRSYTTSSRSRSIPDGSRSIPDSFRSSAAYIVCVPSPLDLTPHHVDLDLDLFQTVLDLQPPTLCAYIPFHTCPIYPAVLAGNRSHIRHFPLEKNNQIFAFNFAEK